MNNFWTISHYLFEKLDFVYIDMVNLVLDLNWLKYMLETIYYYKVHPFI